VRRVGADFLVPIHRQQGGHRADGLSLIVVNFDQTHPQCTIDFLAEIAEMGPDSVEE
jgi:hypothetical protein